MKEKKIDLIPQHVLDSAFKQALAAYHNAYAPYSEFQVGSVLALKSEKNPQLWPQGCNVENGSFGGTRCAEQNTIGAAVVAKVIKDAWFLVVVTHSKKPTPPCGICLQILSEFFTGDLPIYLADLNGITKSYSFKDLLPQQYIFSEHKTL